MIPLLAVILALSIPASSPIVRRSDRPDSAYCNLGSRARALVSIGRDGDGALIGSRWVLTAGHVARSLSTREEGMKSVEVGGATYEVQQTFVHPEWTEGGPHDIGLLYLTRPVVGVIPVLLYRDTAEKALVATMPRHGQTEDGKACGATSRVDSVDAQWIYFSFGSTPSGTDLEGASGAGDSGAPAIIVINKMPFVAGVSLAGSDAVSGAGRHGAGDVFTRVSTNTVWIDKVMMAATSGRSDTASGRPSGKGGGGRGSRGPRH